MSWFARNRRSFFDMVGVTPAEYAQAKSDLEEARIRAIVREEVARILAEQTK